MRPDSVGSGGFDSHTLPPSRLPDEVLLPSRTGRTRATRSRFAALVVGGALLFPVGSLTAQRADSARAGAPQVIVPLFGDQPYWASRVRELGIGTSIPLPELTADHLANPYPYPYPYPCRYTQSLSVSVSLSLA